MAVRLKMRPPSRCEYYSAWTLKQLKILALLRKTTLMDFDSDVALMRSKNLPALAL